MFTFSEMLAPVESESSFGAYVCHRRPGGSMATSHLVDLLIEDEEALELLSQGRSEKTKVKIDIKKKTKKD